MRYLILFLPLLAGCGLVEILQSEPVQDVVTRAVRRVAESPSWTTMAISGGTVLAAIVAAWAGDRGTRAAGRVIAKRVNGGTPTA